MRDRELPPVQPAPAVSRVLRRDPVGRSRARIWPWITLSTVVLGLLTATTPDLGPRVTTTLVVTIAVHVAGRTWWQWRARREPTSPLVPAALDLALTVTVLLAIPPLGIPGLFVVLILTSRVAALRGFWAAVPLALVAFLAVVVRSLSVEFMTRDLWILVVMFGLTTLFSAGIIDRVVRDRDDAHERLLRIDAALATVSGSLSEDPERLVEVLATSTHELVDAVTDVRVVTGDDVAGTPIAADAVAGGTTCTEEGPPRRLALPLAAGGRTVGAVLVVTDRALHQAEVRLLGLWVERIAGAVLLDEARRREGAARDELERAGQLRDELLARVSHDLRVPLATVAGAAQTLAREGHRLDPDQLARLHGMVARNAERLRRWVEEIFDDASHGLQRSLSYGPASLADAVHAAVETGAGDLRAHRVTVQVEDVAVLIDDDAVARVLTNLLSNAAKFSPPGTRIVVDADVRDDDVVVRVTDEGPGIPADDLESVFDPWTRRGGDDTDGAGLGLSIARSLVEQWRGVMWAESPGRQGARLSFTLPRATADGAAVATRTATV